MTAAVSIVVGSLALLAVLREHRDTPPPLPYRVEQLAVAVVTSVRGLLKAARIAAGGAR